MKREDLEHIIRSASAIFGELEWVVVGSQSILGEHPDADAFFLQSQEADIYARFNPAESDKLDAVIGEGSSFHCTFGYYAQGVDEKTAILPLGWEGRLTAVDIPEVKGAKAYCINTHDMACSKMIAGRPKDVEFVSALFQHNLVSIDIMLRRVDLLPVEDDVKEIIKTKLIAYNDQPAPIKPAKPKG